jgi:hypothetical protein
MLNNRLHWLGFIIKKNLFIQKSFSFCYCFVYFVKHQFSLVNNFFLFLAFWSLIGDFFLVTFCSRVVKECF